MRRNDHVFDREASLLTRLHCCTLSAARPGRSWRGWTAWRTRGGSATTKKRWVTLSLPWYGSCGNIQLTGDLWSKHQFLPLQSGSTITLMMWFVFTCVQGSIQDQSEVWATVLIYVPLHLQHSSNCTFRPSHYTDGVALCFHSAVVLKPHLHPVSLSVGAVCLIRLLGGRWTPLLPVTHEGGGDISISCYHIGRKQKDVRHQPLFLCFCHVAFECWHSLVPLVLKWFASSSAVNVTNVLSYMDTVRFLNETRRRHICQNSFLHVLCAQKSKDVCEYVATKTFKTKKSDLNMDS